MATLKGEKGRRAEGRAALKDEVGGGAQLELPRGRKGGLGEMAAKILVGQTAKSAAKGGSWEAREAKKEGEVKLEIDLPHGRPRFLPSFEELSSS